jgi:hypothetical protein
VAALDPATGVRRVVVQAGRFAGIGDPRVIPGTDRLVMTAASGGRWDLWTADLATGETRRLTDDACVDRDPVPTPDGRFVLYATDRRGTFNVHARDLATGATYRVTNVVGGAFWPAPGPDGRALAFSTWSGRGYDLAVMRLDPSSWTPADGPAGGGCRIAAGDALPAPRAAEEPAPADAPAEDYSAWPSFRPRSLSPIVRVATDGTATLGAEASATDALRLHAMAASFETDATRWRPTASVSYSYLGWWPAVSLDLATWPSARRARIDDRSRIVTGRTWLASPSLSLSIPGRERSFAVGLSYSISWTVGLDSPPVGHDPASTQPVLPDNERDAAVTLAASHDSTESYAWSIGPERGVDAGVSLTLRHPGIGAEGSAVTAGAHVYGYVRLPWAAGHVLALLASGALSRGDDGARDTFSAGGFPAQDLASAIVNRMPLSGRYLRGFPAGLLYGDTTVLANVEYRLPLWYVHRGLDTLPVAARRLWGVAFADAGGAWTGRPGIDDFRVGVGAELALSWSLFFAFDSVLRLGYAHGIGPGGEDVAYFLLTR